MKQYSTLNLCDLKWLLKIVNVHIIMEVIIGRKFNEKSSNAVHTFVWWYLASFCFFMQ